MKRLPQTLTAAVLTGALAFGGAAVAQAQTEENTTATTPAEEVTGEIKRHDVAADPITVDGVEYFKQVDGSWLSKPVAGDPVRLTPEQAEKFVKEQQDTSAIPAPATKMDAEGNTWYQSMKDPSVYVKDPALVNVEVTPEMRDAYAKAFPSETPSDPQKPGFDAKKLAWLALPAALIIGGITWYLSQDGKTYVKDEARKNQQPTAEEKAASEQMLNANKNEVIAQGGKLADGAKTTGATRGMAAETGSNTVARGLAGLAVAAMVAAAAFAARRKFFA
ncbi:TPA: hypothetical protein I8V98_002421 [Corynebacterium striatum]|uniref:hypothetical protein n=1 Tax=Corynebacterium TaxID=1716 RepID=UPI0008A5F0E0|nr:MULTISPECIES: hypothetical protein [Corynebacterium]EGT5592752.1 hypothetical protein [Corynebacterium striatum]OFT60653.1 hypothetical protein HMPREF3148_11515 [Corynebacterium sp. HMSC05D08]QRP18953.1 hypothetical protein I6J27_00335 [Corynebacterium striatum]HAT1303931.1 hypothetical protein [Corynebacterium striatum]HAT1392608.1 hypothetical protein [Corynebacterium striatum]